MSFTKHKDVITKKEHRCGECNRIISKGETARYSVTTDHEFTSNILSVYCCQYCRKF